MDENLASATTDPKPKGNHPIACQGKASPIEQKAEPLR